MRMDEMYLLLYYPNVFLYFVGILFVFPLYFLSRIFASIFPIFIACFVLVKCTGDGGEDIGDFQALALVIYGILFVGWVILALFVEFSFCILRGG